jgi:hypothetical protein
MAEKSLVNDFGDRLVGMLAGGLLPEGVGVLLLLHPAATKPTTRTRHPIPLNFDTRMLRLLLRL